LIHFAANKIFHRNLPAAASRRRFNFASVQTNAKKDI
jgi:hypothetical protein